MKFVAKIIRNGQKFVVYCLDGRFVEVPVETF